MGWAPNCTFSRMITSLRVMLNTPHLMCFIGPFFRSASIRRHGRSWFCTPHIGPWCPVKISPETYPTYLWSVQPQTRIVLVWLGGLELGFYYFPYTFHILGISSFQLRGWNHQPGPVVVPCCPYPMFSQVQLWRKHFEASALLDGEAETEEKRWIWSGKMSVSSWLMGWCEQNVRQKSDSHEVKLWF